MISIILLAVLATSGLFCIWMRWKLYKISWQLKGPLALPFIGNAWMLFGKTHEDYVKIIDGVFDKYGTMSRVWLGPRLYILLKDPERIRAVLLSEECVNRDDVYELVNLLGHGGGLMTQKGDTWKAHRKFLNPCFSPKILQSYMPIFNEKSAVLMEKLNEKVDDVAFNFYDSMDACTLDMICQTTLGLDMNIQKGRNADYLQAINTLQEIVTFRIFRPMLHWDFLFKFSPFYGTAKKMQKITSGFVDKVLEKKLIEYREKQLLGMAVASSKISDEANGAEYRKPQIYIDKVLEMFHEGKLENKTVVKDHVGTNIATGFETAALTTSNCVLMLAIYHDIQEKLFEEITNYYGKGNRELRVEYDDLDKLPYLELVLKETLRFFPVLPYGPRKLRKDFILDGYKVPKGCRILVSTYSLHHDKEIWGPTADKFFPDRFLPENSENRHSYSYIPFGGGIRACIGMKYSLLAMKTTLIHLVTNYKFSTELTLATLRPKIDVTLQLVNKHMVSIEKR